MTYKKVKNLKAEDFKRLTGVHLDIFNQRVEIVKQAEKSRKKPGRPPKLRIEDQILMLLEYLREYRTFFHLGATWGVNESTAYRIIQKIENILIKAPQLRLPGKKRLIADDCPLETVVIDVSETPIERPKKKQKTYYSGKKKRHTLKAQVIIDQKNGQILCTAYGKGREQDFKLYKRSKIRIRKKVRCLADKGYQGIKKHHHFSQTPKKKPKKSKLSVAEIKENRKLAKKRIIIENIFAHLKRFKILQGRYRNRRKRFGLRFNLIASIYNYELKLNENQS
ncbi:IS5 family transposase [Synechocystis sp. PCC 7509]|uniref:IS5 family transposase n=1 Tax=Synechocystis sp. PCC 7509 TaxID=927677 RepID=UPI00192C0690|nr:IS5 family transposase [Synechocystis sp. PCC 7509]